jgi:hypothetical protein
MIGDYRRDRFYQARSIFADNGHHKRALHAFLLR